MRIHKSRPDPHCAEVAIGLPPRTTFHYSVPERFQDELSKGMRVLVPFRNSQKVGYVVAFSKGPKGIRLKEIDTLIDREAPIIKQDVLKLTQWVSAYYGCSWGEAIEAAIPPQLKRGRTLKPLCEESQSEPRGRSFILTAEQKNALRRITKAIGEGSQGVFLLYGITGSGKTEIYLQAIEKAIARHQSSIVLVPEISLTPQMIEWFTLRFGGRVATLHSRLTPAERFKEWTRIYNGKADIVIGARSAVFAPVNRLGLIIVDEEQETSYKQEDTPRYNARDVALTRAGICGAVAILGGATPSLESFYQASCGRYELIHLKKRVKKRTLPQVQIVDMREEARAQRRKVVISKPLEIAISETLKKRQQVILFLNRRGFATFAQCKKCGDILRCKRCSIPLVFHSQRKRLICHYCNYQISPPDVCPSCKSSYINYLGLGTQKLESEAYRLFPQARIERMDSDTTRKRTSHTDILYRFKKGDTDILIGTQMIAKGLDFPQVTLVGIASGDTALGLPDFRAGERTFSLLTQVAGRAGRGETKGRVIIQSFTPEHFTIRCAKKHDYEGFYKQEIKFREELRFPPFCHLINIRFKASKEDAVKAVSLNLRNALLKEDREKTLEIIGPAPLLIAKLKGMFRWSVTIKTDDVIMAQGIITRALKRIRRLPGRGLIIDTDPLWLM